MIADDLATYLANNTSLVKGRNLYVNNTPENKSSCVTVYDTGGMEPDHYLMIDEYTAQISIREGSNHARAKERAKAIYNLLNRKLNFTVGDLDVMKCHATAPPQMVGLDEKNRWQITINFVLMIRKS